MTEGPWTITGTIIGAVVLLVSLGILWTAVNAEYLEPKRRTKKRRAELEHPADVSFLIPSMAVRATDCAIQDNADHEIKEIVLQSHSEYTVELLIKPRTHFVTTQIAFGCQGDFVNRPEPLEFKNPFIIAGDLQSGVPGKTPGHNISHHKHYLWHRSITWTVGTHLCWGFKIKTHGPGKFPTTLFFSGEEVEGRADLIIRAEDHAPIRMTCVSEGHESHQLRPIFKRS